MRRLPHKVEKFRKKAVFLSPHPDDSAFSLGGSISSLLAIWDISVITVFTQSKYAPGLQSNDSTIISELRHLEERSFMRWIGVDSIYLPFPDSSLRGYDDLTELTHENHHDPIAEEVVSSLKSNLESMAPTVVIAPLGIGGHVDHLIVRKFVSFLSGNFEKVYYEEQPYSAAAPRSEIRRMAHQLAVGLRVEFSGLSPQRREAISHYPSQFPDEGFLGDLAYGEESIWISSSDASLFEPTHQQRRH